MKCLTDFPIMPNVEIIIFTIFLTYIVQFNLKLLIQSRSLYIELAVLQRDGQRVLQLDGDGHLLLGDGLAVHADLDIGVAHPEVVLREVVELFVDYCGDGRDVERCL